MFNIVEQNVERYAQYGDTLLMGGFNTRTACRDDVDRTSVNIPLVPVDGSQQNSNKEIPDRYNCDTKMNEPGGQRSCLSCVRLVICPVMSNVNLAVNCAGLTSSTSHALLNGQSVCDSMGHFTFLNEKWLTVHWQAYS